MKIELGIKVAILIVAMLTGGCAAVYPKQNQNVLEKPIEFSYSHLTEPSITKEEAIAKAKSELQRRNLVVDKLSNELFEKYVSEAYESALKSLPSNELDFIGENITTIFKNNAILKSKYGSPSFILQPIRVFNKQDGNFEVNLSYKTGVFSYVIGAPPGYRSDATFDAIISGKYTTSNGIVSGNFYQFGYTLNENAISSSWSASPETIEIVRVDELAIPASLRVFSTTANKKEIDLVQLIANYLGQKLSKRYDTSFTNATPKVEKKYKIDFASAKARLQRALGGFKYDDAKSTFNFEQEFSENGKTVYHKFAISLFPDRSDTVVQFSGEYRYIVDKLGGPNIFGPDAYSKKMDEYIKNVASILNL